MSHNLMKHRSRSKREVTVRDDGGLGLLTVRGGAPLRCAATFLVKVSRKSFALLDAGGTSRYSRPLVGPHVFSMCQRREAAHPSFHSIHKEDNMQKNTISLWAGSMMAECLR
jgi:hypothetical protein